MGFALLIGLTMVAFFLLGPPLLMFYASLQERKQRRLQATQAKSEAGIHE